MRNKNKLRLKVRVPGTKEGMEGVLGFSGSAA